MPAPTTPDITAPTGEGQPAGHPPQRVPLAKSLLDAINAAATSTAPADKVARSASVPLVKEEVEAGATPAPAPAPPTPPKPEAAKPATPTAPPTPPEPDKPKKGIDQVREAHERAVAKATELERSLTATAAEKAEAFKKVADLEGKVRTFEEKFAKEYEPQLKRLTEKEKRLQEVEDQLKLIDYTKSPEFHDRNIRPITEASRDVEDLLKQMAVVDPDGKPQAATMAHFNAILGAPSLNESERVAKGLFGEGFATTELVRQSARIRSLQRNLTEAQQKAQLESVEWHKKQQEAQLADWARFRTTVEERTKGYVVTPAEKDPEEAAAYEAGQSLVTLFDNGVQDVEQRVEVVAKTRAALASDKLKDLRLTRQQKRIGELEAELAAYRRNEPDVETTGGGAPEAIEDAPFGSNPETKSKLLAAARAASRMR
jgi:hypothetical protein